MPDFPDIVKSRKYALSGVLHRFRGEETVFGDSVLLADSEYIAPDGFTDGGVPDFGVGGLDFVHALVDRLTDFVGLGDDSNF